MTHLIKDTFYKEKLLQVSLSSLSFTQDPAKSKESHKQAMSDETVKRALGTFGKTAEGPHYSFLSFIAPNQDLAGLYVCLEAKVGNREIHPPATC